VSLIYLDKAESWSGLPIIIVFLVFVCIFSIKRLTIGVLEITAISEESYWDRSLEWAIKTRFPYS
jgi:hypothetical protein